MGGRGVLAAWGPDGGRVFRVFDRLWFRVHCRRQASQQVLMPPPLCRAGCCVVLERSQPAVPLARQPAYQRFVHPGPLVLWAGLLKIPTSAEDRDQTVSRRSEPSSRAALIGERPNPWDLLQPQDATSRHRGAKPSRRYGLLGMISLLSPGYLLSVEGTLGRLRYSLGGNRPS